MSPTPAEYAERAEAEISRLNAEIERLTAENAWLEQEVKEVITRATKEHIENIQLRAALKDTKP